MHFISCIINYSSATVLRILSQHIPLITLATNHKLCCNKFFIPKAASSDRHVGSKADVCYTTMQKLFMKICLINTVGYNCLGLQRAIMQMHDKN